MVNNQTILDKELTGVIGSYHSLRSFRELTDITHAGYCPLTPGDRKGA